MERRRDDHSNGNLSCSFCGKSQKEVKKLIAGPTVYICDECIGLCNDIIAEEVEKDEPYAGSTPVPKPAEIKAILDDYVIGQERAKKVLKSVRVDTELKTPAYVNRPARRGGLAGAAGRWGRAPDHGGSDHRREISGPVRTRVFSGEDALFEDVHHSVHPSGGAR